MSLLSIIVKKEITDTVTSKRNIFTTVVILVYWVVMSHSSIKSAMKESRIDNLIFSFTTLIGLYGIFLFSNNTFLMEKYRNRFETLLCSPASLQTIWLGKVLSVAIVNYLFAVFIFIATYLVSFFFAYKVQPPSVFIVIYIILIMPVFFTFITSLIGYFQLVVGLKYIQIVSVLYFIAIFVLLNLSKELIDSPNFINGLFFIIIFVVSVLLVLLLFYLIKFLNKEKIITSIKSY